MNTESGMNAHPPQATPVGAAAIVLHARSAFLAGMTAWLLVLAAHAAPPPDACIEGFVWREAFPGDHVCVTPEVREQAARDNRLAASRREPQGGAYGADTCKPGFVWREARPQDHVCVTPEVREQTARDNRLAMTRLARPIAGEDQPVRTTREPPRPHEDAEATQRAEERRSAEQPAKAASPRPPSYEMAPPAPEATPKNGKPAAKAKAKPNGEETAAVAYRFRLPEFPWPPPPYSTRLKLARELVVAGQASPTLGSVAQRFEHALAANGYTLVSYYAVPDGFAMVTQVERLGPGARSAAEQRWSTQIDPVSLIPFNLDAYIQALLGKNGDSFRVIVFAFTPQPFTADSRPASPETIEAWVEKGATALPASLATLPYGEPMVCTALVYEFRISSLGTALQRPGEFDGSQHLRASGILTALEQQP